MQNCGDPNCKDCNPKPPVVTLAIQRPAQPGNVPCNGCTLCCQGDAIRLLPGDDPSQYQTEPHERFEGQLMLAHKANGDCIYLTSGGCSIHDRKPQMCRDMDCRKIARRFKRGDLKRLNCPVKVWNRGRQLIGRSW